MAYSTFIIIVVTSTALATTQHESTFDFKKEQQNTDSKNMNLYGKINTSESTKPCNCVLTTCHCSGSGLQSIPDNLPTYITVLDLFTNSIELLPNKTFCVYPTLQILILEANQINRLNTESFVCLSKLIFLNLRNNSLEMTRGTYPRGVFKPLNSLLVLYINLGTKKSLDTYEYPDEALGDLTTLRVLHMDGISNKTFGEGFIAMKSLRTLSLSGFEGFCNLSILSRETFVNLSQLTKLNISSCHMKHTSLPKDIFLPLKKLMVLDIHNNYLIGLEKFTQVMSVLKESKSDLRALIATAVISRFSLGITVNSSLADVLPTNLTFLEARNNCFEYIDADVFAKLPRRLRYVEMGSNRFVFGDYVKKLILLKNLEILKLNGWNFLSNIPVNFPHLQAETLFFDENFPDNGVDEKEKLNLTFPLKLNTIDISTAGLKYILTELEVNSANNVENLILSNNYFPTLTGPFRGFNKLKYLEIRRVLVSEIRPAFFKYFPSLLTLNLEGNNLADLFEKNAHGNFSLFEDLSNLTSLDLSENQLRSLPRDMFKGLDNLEILNLQGNSMWNFTVSISHMRKLKLLNLSRSEITHFPLDIRHHIDTLSNTTAGVQVDLSLSPLRCDCENFEFLQWMVKSPAFDQSFSQYMCSDDNDTIKCIRDQYSETLRSLGKKCPEHGTLFSVVLAGTLCLLSFVLIGALYRFRWKLRYLYYMAYRNLNVRDNAQRLGNFRYDVFVSYASEEEGFVMSHVMRELCARGLTLCIHGRDFSVGDYIASNIVTAVHESRKTLVVLTQKFVASKWCNYELQMANMESVHTGRQVLVILIKESIPSRDLGTDLLYHIRSNTYKLYPQADEREEEAVFKGFWDKLAHDIKV
ncbi:unnamed protein product [Lymnaea stagnalis]|uniref:TIR domain-containing protein n=1 Tax=Lymnaea stagnalis TaxID=6523 RepID=A0AAV2IQR8_LYMST